MTNKIKDAIDRATRDLLSYEGPFPGGPQLLTSDLRLILDQINRLTEASQAIETKGKADSPHPDRPTLRDRFAMAALTGLLAGGGIGQSNNEVAQYAGDLADAMMKERHK